MRAALVKGNECARSGDAAGAARAFASVVALQPRFAEGYLGLGWALEQLGRKEEALTAYRQAVTLAPALARARQRLGSLLAQIGEAEAAIEHLQEAVRLDPRDGASLINLGSVLASQERLRDARLAFERAVDVTPKLAQGHFNLGNMVRQLDGDARSIPHYERAVALDPGYVKAWRALASAQRRQDEDRSAECFLKVLAFVPDDLRAVTALLDIHQRACDFDRAEAYFAALVKILERRDYREAAWDTLASAAYRWLFAPFPDALLRQLTHEIGLRLTAQTGGQSILPSLPSPPAARTGRLRIGYMTPNLRDHPVGHVTLSLFREHDRSRFEVHAFTTRDLAQDPTAYARWHRESFDAMHQVDRTAPRSVAQAIRAAGIDILVDLDGYMEHSSPPVLALRPAPVQAFWLGHAGGLGLPFVDYLIADGVTVPPGEESRYREAVVRLPDSYHCADRHPVANGCPERAAWGLPEHGIVFCAFNNPEKIDRRAFACWMRILRAVDGSVLWLSAFRQRRETLLGNLSREAERNGVEPSRLILASRVPEKSLHLARLGHADLMLDTLTLNASTTALDALWAGVPLLAVRGSRFPGRISSSMLQAAGLPDLICTDLEEYERRAIALARDPAALRQLRQRLADQRLSCPLFDIGRFTRHLECAYERMWERYCSGESPAAFDVPPV